MSAYRALNTHGLAVFENHFAHQRVGDDLQVAAAHGGAQERVGCRLPQAIANGHLPQTKAFFALAIEVWGVSVPQSFTGFDKTCTQGVHLVGKITDTHFSASTMVGRCPPHMVFRFFEIRQNIVPAPTSVACVTPVVEIAFLAAHINHRVQAAAATQYFSPGPKRDPVIQCRIRLGGVHPVVFGV